MNFTNDEMNLMCIYNTGSRESLMRLHRCRSAGAAGDDGFRAAKAGEHQRRGIYKAGTVPGFLIVFWLCRKIG